VRTRRVTGFPREKEKGRILETNRRSEVHQGGKRKDDPTRGIVFSEKKVLEV